MANRRKTRTLPVRNGAYLRRCDVLALLSREHDAQLAHAEDAPLIVRAEHRGAAQALRRMSQTIERMQGVGG